MNRETAEPSVETFPGPKARERVAAYREHAATSTHVYGFVWDVVEPAEGPFCTDADGNILLDFTSHVGAAALGYNNPDLRARMAEFDLVDPLKIAGQDFYTTAGDPAGVEFPGPAELMDRLVDVSPGMNTVFLSNSGAEAVENAIKVCYDKTGGRYGVTFHGAFHGRTLGALSLNRSKGVYRRDFPEVAGVHDVPYCDNRACDPATCSCGFFTEGGSQLREMLHPERGYVDPDEVAYLIVEPVQGEGGYRIPSVAFLREVADVAAAHNILVVADEIQTGLGRSGDFWAAEATPLEPDVITAAKGLRVGATIAREGVFPDERARLSSTWGAGDLLSSLQGVVTIDVIREQGLMANAVARGNQALARLSVPDLPGVEDVRGRGLLLAVEFDAKPRRDAVVEAATKRGLLTLGCGHKTLRLLPPLDVTQREIALGCDLLVAAIHDTARAQN
jgi:4-aminobutyrate aminotransferase